MKLLARIHYAIRWRLYEVVIALRPWLARLIVFLRWHFADTSKLHNLHGEVIISLTSYPARYDVLPLTLKSLLRQTIKADRVILWIAQQDMATLPKNVLALCQHGLNICAVDDLRSYKKIIPALEQFPKAHICTADDDLYYRPNWLKELVEGIEVNSGNIPCHRAHAITVDQQGNYKPYDEWVFDTLFRGSATNLFATGGSGILFPPQAFAPEVTNRTIFMNICPDGDDIWLYWMIRRAGNKYKTIGHRRDIIAWTGSQKETLYHHNVLQGGNDKQIVKMAEFYGYPDVS